MIWMGKNGLLADFFDADALAAKAVTVLQIPRSISTARTGRAEAESYSMEAVMPRMVGMYEAAVAARRALPQRPEPEPVPELPATPFRA